MVTERNPRIVRQKIVTTGRFVMKKDILSDSKLDEIEERFVPDFTKKIVIKVCVSEGIPNYCDKK